MKAALIKSEREYEYKLFLMSTTQAALQERERAAEQKQGHCFCLYTGNLLLVCVLTDLLLDTQKPIKPIDLGSTKTRTLFVGVDKKKSGG